MPIPGDYLSELNDKQREAVLATEGPLLIVAGAGSGKTRVLIYRMIHLVQGRGISPSRILGVTFTNRAAEEMKSRIRKSLGEIAARIWIATFHSTCAQILRQEIHHLGYSRSFVIYDEDDSLSLIKRVVKDKGLDEKMYPAKWLRSRIEWIKRDLVELGEQFNHQYGQAAEGIKQVYQEYQTRLKIYNALDFNDLLLLTVNLFEREPGVLEKFQDRFRYIMVDEYQDTNYIQYLLVRLLAKKYGNVCVVGDEDQSIYMWRGANIENILNFESDFPNAKVIKMEQNYRSTKRIIETASVLISHNQKRLAKTLWTDNPEGEQIRLVECLDDRQEAERAVETMLRLKSEGYKYRDFSVFYRVNAQSRPVEDALRGREIPYQVFGGLKFYDRKEVKDLLAYLRLLINPDDTVALLRVINTPARGIGQSTIEQLNRLAETRGESMFKAVPDAAGSSQFPERARKALRNFHELISQTRKFWKDENLLSELVEFTMDKSGYEQELLSEATVESEARLENLEELVTAVAEYESNVPEPSLEGFLERTALFNDIDRFSEQGLVSLMTLHTAKGLEFPVVMVLGLEEGLLPHVRSLAEGEEDALEEERRLFYVGMTRAKQRLYLYYARRRMLRGIPAVSSPSRFIEELPAENIKAEHVLGREPGREPQPRKTGGKAGRGFEPDYSGQEVWDSEQEISWRPGMKVRHDTFGEGEIERIEGSEDKIKLVVKFKQAGRKKILARYARLETR